MGLRPGRGPTWEEDSFGYINTDVAEMNILSQKNIIDYLDSKIDCRIIEINPYVSRQIGARRDLENHLEITEDLQEAA